MGYEFDLDQLIEASVVQAQLADGMNPQIVSARSTLDARGLLVLENATKARVAVRANAARWNADEIEFLKRWHNVLTEREIAEALGRSQNGVHIFSERHLGLPRPTKDPRVITTGEIADLLGVGRDTPANWIDAGVLPGYLYPFDGKRIVRLVKRVQFMMWLVNPLNWIYFDPRKVREPYLKRLLELKQARWGDAWWTPGQVERYHGLSQQGAYKQIARRLGSTAARWGNHRILRSTAVNLRLYSGKGSVPSRTYSPEGEGFMVLARAVGLSPKPITDLLTRHHGFTREQIQLRHVPETFADDWFVAKRIAYLRNKNQLDAVLTAQRLRVVCGAYTLDVFADWKHYRARFPALARAMDKFRAVLDGHDARLSEKELWMVRGVLARWALHFVGNAGFMNNQHGLSIHWLCCAYERLTARGVDIYEEGYMSIKITPHVAVKFVVELDEQDAHRVVNDPKHFARELKAAMQEAGVGERRNAKSEKNAKTAKAKNVKTTENSQICPHCEKAGFKGVSGVNRHIGHSHPNYAKVNALVSAPSAKANGHLQAAEN